MIGSSGNVPSSDIDNPDFNKTQITPQADRNIDDSFTKDQLALLNRILGRMKQMHSEISPFAIGLAMRANDQDLPLEQIKAWLEVHRDDPTSREIATLFSNRSPRQS